MWTTYYGGLTDAVSEYLTVTHDGFAGRKAMVAVNHLASEAGVTLADTLEETAGSTRLGTLTGLSTPGTDDFTM